MTMTLVTGATGFLGRALLIELLRQGVSVRAPVRDASGVARLPCGVEALVVGDLTKVPDFAASMEGVDTVIHLAARAHVTSDRGTENSDVYRVTNVVLTRDLATAAQSAGVRRFVFVSSIKAFGETDQGRPYHVDDPPAPCDAYGQSKLDAERALRDVCARGRVQPVIVRPPLVYGPGVRANFLRILRLVDRELPLPFAAIRNRRSMISTANLVDFLCVCRASPSAADQTLLVSDGEDLSTPDLVRGLARIMGRRPRLFPVPVPVLRVLARAVGYGAEVTRLTDSLSMNIEASRDRVRWTPPASIETGLATAVDDYLRSKRG